MVCAVVEKPCAVPLCGTILRSARGGLRAPVPVYNRVTDPRGGWQLIVVAVLAAAAGLAGCVRDTDGSGTARAWLPHGSAAGATEAIAGAASAAGTAGVAASDVEGVAREADAIGAGARLPARIRRLSNAEYNGSVAALLGSERKPARGFAPDARQGGFTVSEAQRVDAVLARQLFAAAEQLSAEARGRTAQLAPCATPTDPEGCARAFIHDFGARAFRRPLIEEESALCSSRVVRGRACGEES